MKGSLLRYGFKAEAERKAIKLRNEMSLKSHDALSAFDLAKHIGVPLLTPLEAGLSKSEANLLLRNGSGWWGLTIKNHEGHWVVIYNNYQSANRQQSTIMHEIAHIICEHELPAPVLVANCPLPLRHYDASFEEEANCLGSCLQITREGLLWALKKGMSIQEVSLHFQASEAMVNYRIRTTGVNKQLEFAKKYY